jgi:hypothetical protein
MIKAATIELYAERFAELTKMAELQGVAITEQQVPQKAYDIISQMINDGSFEKAYDIVVKLNNHGYKIKSDELDVPNTQLLEFERFIRDFDQS